MIWLAAPDPKLDRRCFIVRDYKGQALAYVYFEGEPGRLSRRLKGPGHSGGTKTISLRSCNGVSVSRVWGGRWRSGSGWNLVGVVSVFNLESPGVRAPERRPRHDERYHEA
jgi:hypothetical protein